MTRESSRTSPNQVLDLLDLMCELLGADAARFFVADYSLRRLQQITDHGPVGLPQTIEGTLIGRVFTSREIQVVGKGPTVVLVPLVEGSSPVGILELDFEVWNGLAPQLVEPIVATFVMTWIVKGRYTDTAARARRSEPLSAAAEIQWDLLPPLACSTERAAVSGILEPAYDIGGDSFDYAFDASRITFTIVDAVGHGMAAVLMSAAAINTLAEPRQASSPPTTTPADPSRRSSGTPTTSQESSERWTCRAGTSRGSTAATSCRCWCATAPTSGP
jgi:sigma-B regulation protein RsbU (phosphoserine phosphatase)